MEGTKTPPFVWGTQAGHAASVSASVGRMGPVRAGLEAGSGQRAGERRLPWPVLLLTLAAVSSSFLSAVSLYQLLALRAEVDTLRSEVGRRREDGQQAPRAGQVSQQHPPGCVAAKTDVLTVCLTLLLIRWPMSAAGEAVRRSEIRSLGLTILSSLWGGRKGWWRVQKH